MEMTFKTIFMQRSTHSVQFCYVRSVKYIKFILAVQLVFCLFLARKDSFLKSLVFVSQFVPHTQKRLFFPKCDKSRGSILFYFQQGKIILLGGWIVFNLDGRTVLFFFFTFNHCKIIKCITIQNLKCVIKQISLK